MVTFLLCQIFALCYLPIHALISFTYLKLNGKKVRIDSGGNTLYNGKIGSTTISFGWQNILQFFMTVAENQVPEIGKEYLAKKNNEEMSTKDFIFSTAVSLTFLLLCVLSAFSFSNFLSYLPTILKYIFFMNDATTLPSFNLFETIIFYLSCMFIYGMAMNIIQFGYSKTYSLSKGTLLFSIVFGIFLFTLLFFWIATVSRLFLLHHTFLELILLILMYLLINSAFAVLLFIVYKIFFKLEKRTPEEIRIDSALLKIKEYLQLSASHTILDSKTDALSLFSEERILQHLEKRIYSKSGGVYPEADELGISADTVSEIAKEVKKFKMKNEFLPKSVVDSMNIYAYCVESFKDSVAVVVIKHNSSSASWDRRITFEVGYDKNNVALILPGNYENGFVFPWLKMENL